LVPPSSPEQASAMMTCAPFSPLKRQPAKLAAFCRRRPERDGDRPSGSLVEPGAVGFLIGWNIRPAEPCGPSANPGRRPASPRRMRRPSRPSPQSPGAFIRDVVYVPLGHSAAEGPGAPRSPSRSTASPARSVIPPFSPAAPQRRHALQHRSMAGNRTEDHRRQFAPVVSRRKRLDHGLPPAQSGERPGAFASRRQVQLLARFEEPSAPLTDAVPPQVGNRQRQRPRPPSPSSPMEVHGIGADTRLPTSPRNSPVSSNAARRPCRSTTFVPRRLRLGLNRSWTPADPRSKPRQGRGLDIRAGSPAGLCGFERPTWPPEFRSSTQAVTVKAFRRPVHRRVGPSSNGPSRLPGSQRPHREAFEGQAGSRRRWP